MKPLLFTLLLVLSAACGGSEIKGESKDTQHIQVDDKQVDDKEADTSSTDCSSELELVCAEGSVDGCGVTDESGASLTLFHICVPASESAAGPACEQEIARVCDDGFVDACLLTPAASTTHVCVMQPTVIQDPMSDADPDQGDDEDDNDMDSE